MVLLPDEDPEIGVRRRDRAATEGAGKVLRFAHGSTSASADRSSADVDVVMIAPKGPGHSRALGVSERLRAFSMFAIPPGRHGPGPRSGDGLCQGDRRAPRRQSLKPIFKGRNRNRSLLVSRRCSWRRLSGW